MHVVRLLALVLSLAIVGSLTECHAGLGPENVAVVVNADSWASMTVANAFIARHHVPSCNIIYLEDVSGYEHIGIEEFRERLLKPVLKSIEERGLRDQIDCIAWSSDFPYGIEVQADADTAKLKLPQVFTPVASINGLTYLYEQVLAKDPRYLELGSNWYYRRPFRADGKDAPGAAIITAEELGKFREAMKLVGEKKWAEATPLLAELATAHPKESQLQYNLACCLAQQEKPDDAMKALQSAVEAGWFDRQHTEKDEDLKPLREREDFKSLLGKMTPPLFDVPPPAGFRSSYRWNEKGERVETGGRRYMLSVMLAVTSGRGNSVRDAVRLFEDSLALPEEKPISQGTIYFVRNGDVRSRTREWAFASAVEKLKKLGMKAEIVDGVLPDKKDDVAGAVVGIADFDWAKSGSHILRGAIVEHLTSFGGVMREHSGQTPLTAFLKHGAAGSSGTVTEPFAIQAKFPTPFLHVHYSAGATLAEAFYQSVQGPYQLLIVGDPLSRPFGPSRYVEIEKGGPEYEKSFGWHLPLVLPRKGKHTLIPKLGDPHSDEANQPGGADGKQPAVDRFELFIDGRRTATCQPGESLEIELESPAAGWHDVRIAAILRDSRETRTTSLTFHLNLTEEGRTATLDVQGLRLNGAMCILSGGDVASANEPLTMAARSSGAKSIELQHGSRTLRAFGAASGLLDLLPMRLGQGAVALRSIGKFDGTNAYSTAERFFVEPGTPLAAVSIEKPETLVDGLKLTNNDLEAVVTDTRSADWLAKAGLKPGDWFTLRGVLRAENAKDPGAQFQVISNREVTLRIDDKPLRPIGTGRWQYLPVWLEDGWHRLEVRGRVPENPKDVPRLTIRYGVEGTQSLDGARFKHEPTE